MFIERHKLHEGHRFNVENSVFIDVDFGGLRSKNASSPMMIPGIFVRSSRILFFKL